MEQSVKATLIADAPVGALVSGGVDSALIAALALERNPSLKLFNADTGGRKSETPAARLVASALGADLEVAEVDHQRWLSTVVRAVLFDEMPPIYHANSIPFLSVCELVRQRGVKALLTGEGADELFLGYRGSLTRPWAKRRKAALNRLVSTLQHLPQIQRYLAPKLERADRLIHIRLVHQEEEADNGAAFSFVGNAIERDYAKESLTLLRMHLLSLLHRNDRMGMAASIESRFPFLHSGVLRFGINLPVKHKLRLDPRWGDSAHPFLLNKAPVRFAARVRLPHSVAWRPKLGFPIGHQRRVRIAAPFLRGGFLQEEFSLSDREIDIIIDMLGTGLSAAREVLFFTEIWGRVFVRGNDLADVFAHVTRHCFMT